MVNPTKTKVFNNELILSDVGNFGRFQIIILMIFALNNIYIGYSCYSQEVLHYTTNADCYVFERKTPLDNATTTANWVDKTTEEFISYTYEYNYNCMDTWKNYVTKGAFYIGFVIGSFVCGYCGDKYGRVMTMIVSFSVLFFGNTTTMFSKNMALYMISRFLIGFFINANFTMMYILIMEYTKASIRTLALNLTFGLCFSLASSSSPWVALAVGYWKYYMLILCFLQCILFPAYFFIPESYQLFAAGGSISKSIRSLKDIAKINNRHVKSELINYLKRNAVVDILKRGNYVRLTSIFESSKIKKYLDLILIRSFLIGFSFGILTTKLYMFRYSQFIMTSLLSSMHLLAALIVVIFQDYGGRRFLTTLMLASTSVFVTFTTIFLTMTANDHNQMYMFLTVICIIGIESAAISGFQQTGELLPTRVRSQGMCFVITVTYIGYVIGPVAYTMRHITLVPDIIVGVKLVFAALLSVFLPETMDKRLPVTLRESENIDTIQELDVTTSLQMAYEWEHEVNYSSIYDVSFNIDENADNNTENNVPDNTDNNDHHNTDTDNHADNTYNNTDNNIDNNTYNNIDNNNNNIELPIIVVIS